ncbi:hypothetical protein E2C01_041815 [Portunus trituberculatus]|uniref:Uncharacterized protein n=1 Tax=Portunus trituberculatus TaxID=210409 RepID=A0A5B7FKV2_PORTR|nr:hypothetical protein [Portunus trituberculatus]
MWRLLSHVGTARRPSIPHRVTNDVVSPCSGASCEQNDQLTRVPRAQLKRGCQDARPRLTFPPYPPNTPHPP